MDANYYKIAVLIMFGIWFARYLLDRILPMLDLESFFDYLDHFDHGGIFENVHNIWDPLCNLNKTLAQRLSSLSQNDSWIELKKGFRSQHFSACNGDYRERCLIVEEWIEIPAPVFLSDLGIFIGQGTLLEPTAIIKGPAIIGDHCSIRQGAYVRGNVLIGDHVVIGHATEVKNSIIMSYTEAGHFSYIGDSILGSYVNLGAGSKLANLQFRTPQEKRNGIIYPIKVHLEQKEKINTKMEKLGAVIGDFVEIGCNAVTSPGAFIGKRCWVYPNMTVAKGFYESDRIISPKRKNSTTP